MNNRNMQNRFIRVIKKFFYSAFVLSSFIAYALESRGTAALTSISAVNGANPTQSGAAATTAETPTGSANTTTIASPAQLVTAGSAAISTATTAPTATLAATATAAAATSSGLRDGTYTGTQVNVRWGYVQVQATIQNGQIANVQFLEYPNERNTSVRINSTAVPELQQEAIQAQSANVNIITGATLTSEGFQQSLQAALNQAKG